MKCVFGVHPVLNAPEELLGEDLVKKIILFGLLPLPLVPTSFNLKMWPGHVGAEQFVL